jgi:hypothetical protein
MEISSGGCGAGGSAGGGGGDDERLHGLQFGKKIYFEDATPAPGGTSGTSANASSSKAPTGAGRKGKAAAGPPAPAPPRCQVEGCDLDLSSYKTYYCRHKVCFMHAKAPHVVVNGLEQRFCQQCSRSHIQSSPPLLSALRHFAPYVSCPCLVSVHLLFPLVVKLICFFFWTILCFGVLWKVSD